MVDIGTLFGDENEDFRNKAKVSGLLLTFAVRRGNREVLHERGPHGVTEGCASAQEGLRSLKVIGKQTRLTTEGDKQPRQVHARVRCERRAARAHHRKSSPWLTKQGSLDDWDDNMQIECAKAFIDPIQNEVG